MSPLVPWPWVQPGPVPWLPCWQRWCWPAKTGCCSWLFEKKTINRWKRIDRYHPHSMTKEEELNLNLPAMFVDECECLCMYVHVWEHMCACVCVCVCSCQEWISFLVTCANLHWHEWNTNPLLCNSVCLLVCDGAFSKWFVCVLHYGHPTSRRTTLKPLALVCIVLGLARASKQARHQLGKDTEHVCFIS